MDTKRILKSLSKAVGLGFMPSENIGKEPSIVKLSFLNPQDGVDGYECILDFVGNTEATMVITILSKTKLDFHFIVKDTGDNFKIKNLNYSADALSAFEKIEPINSSYILVIGKTPTQSPNFAATRKPYSPLVLNKYVINHLPS